MHLVYDSPQALRVAISLLRDHSLGCNSANDNPERRIILTVHLAWTCKPPDLLGAQCLIRFANSSQTESKRLHSQAVSGDSHAMSGEGSGKTGHHICSTSVPISFVLLFQKFILPTLSRPRVVVGGWTGVDDSPEWMIMG